MEPQGVTQPQPSPEHWTTKFVDSSVGRILEVTIHCVSGKHVSYFRLDDAENVFTEILKTVKAEKSGLLLPGQPKFQIVQNGHKNGN